MKTIAKIATAFVLAILAAAGGALWWLAAAQPRIDGTLRLAGLKAPVTVARDDTGTPRIVADNDQDAYFALGFVHAQDRLWQMEMQRLLGAGRLSEVMGEKTLPVDRFMRTLGLYQLAQHSLALLEPDVQAALTAYATGINAYLQTHSGPLAPEFLLTRHRPEPWTAADSLVWGRLMALQLAGNWRDELLRARLLHALPADMVADLWQPYPTDQPVTLGLSQTFLDAMVAAIPSAVMPKLASNVWVVSGERSQTGKPILANDPHLGFQAPILWYMAVIETPNLHLAGGTVPGNPFLMLGHNNRVAWGLTTTHSDTMDLFIEKPEGDGYLTPDGPAPFVTRVETIKVRGAPDEHLTVRETRHGPVISDLLGERAEGQMLALAATALIPDDRTAQAIYHLNRAQTSAEVLASLHDFHAPQQNIAFADADGHIGLISPGRVPIRKSGDGTLPRPGWTGEFDWIGWVPFEDLPQTLDPPSGLLVNANNKVVGDNYPYLLTAVWPEGYRAQRIQEMLEDQPAHSPADMAAMQMDELSLMAVELRPLLLAAKPSGARARLAQDLLRNWDHVTDRRRAEPLIFEAWLRRFQRNILTTWMGDRAADFPVLNPRFLKAVLTGRTVWCGHPGQPVPDSCLPAVSQALDEALDDLVRHFGEDMADWRWGEAHHAVFDPLLFRYIPVLDRLTTPEIATGGDDFTVQRGSFGDPGALFRHGHGAGMRAIYDLSDLDGSLFVIATGQSGNPLSPHWDDQLRKWRDGEMAPLPPRRPLTHTLVMEPPP